MSSVHNDFLLHNEWILIKLHFFCAGYAITSGHYFDRNRPLYACTDPGWDYVGQVKHYLYFVC